MVSLQTGLDFLHQEFDLQAGDIVEVTLNVPANVMLLDPANFLNYKDGLSYRYHGGHTKKAAVQLLTPRSGTWHVVVNLGGYPGRVTAVVRIFRDEGVASTYMTAMESYDHTQQFSPVHVAPIGSLNAYTIHMPELDVIAAGSTASLGFNLAVALISIGLAFVLTLTTTTIQSDLLFYGYLIACLNCLLAGIILFVYWLKTRISVGATVAKIKYRLIHPTLVQEPPLVHPAGS